MNFEQLGNLQGQTALEELMGNPGNITIFPGVGTMTMLVLVRQSCDGGWVFHIESGVS